MVTTAEKEMLLSVPGTMRLVNETFSEELTDPNSEGFQQIEKYICSQVDSCNHAMAKRGRCITVYED